MKGRNPGRLIQLKDGRLCILYNKQEFKDLTILHRVDDDYKQLYDDKGRPLVISWPLHIFQREMEEAKLIGFTS